MSQPLKVGGYLPKWAPDQSADFQFRVTFPYKVTRDPKCVHANQSAISGTTTHDDDPREWSGTVCCDCGKVLAFGEVDPVTGLPRVEPQAARPA